MSHRGRTRAAASPYSSGNSRSRWEGLVDRFPVEERHGGESFCGDGVGPLVRCRPKVVDGDGVRSHHGREERLRGARRRTSPCTCWTFPRSRSRSLREPRTSAGSTDAGSHGGERWRRSRPVKCIGRSCQAARRRRCRHDARQDQSDAPKGPELGEHLVDKRPRTDGCRDIGSVQPTYVDILEIGVPAGIAEEAQRMGAEGWDSGQSE